MRQANPVSDRRRPPGAARAGPGDRPLGAAHARRRSAAREVADRDRLGRRARAPRRRGLARRTDPADGAVRVNDRLVRTSVFRLARDGWLDASAHGRRSRYRLTRDGARRFDDAYRRIYDRPPEEWHGEWELVLVQRHARGRAAARCATNSRGRASASSGRAASCGRANPAGRCRRSWRPPAIGDRVLVARATDFPGARPLAAAADHAWDLGALAARLPAVPAALRRRHRALPRRRRPRPRTVLRRAHAADPRVSPRAAARPAAARRAASARLAGRRGVRAVPRLLPPDASVGRARISPRRSPARANPWPPANAAFYARFGGLAAD